MKDRAKGFTLIELLTVVAILAILATIALFGYRLYTERARAPDIIEKYDALRTAVNAQAQTSKVDDCGALAQNLGKSNLDSPYATLAYGFEAAKEGYRPVLNVCAVADPSKPLGVKVARAAHDTMLKSGMVEKNAVLTDSVVSFALRLSDGDQALCKTAPPSPTTACGTGPATASGTGPASGAGPGPAANPSPGPVANPGPSPALGAPPVSGGVTPGGGAGAGASPPSPANTASGSPPQPPVNHREQCVTQCRQTICSNCNSKAYRTCVANCPN